MNVEQLDVTLRAARHAALGEPARLRIVDLLTLGDMSPGEIGITLGLPTNLVAHHLNVLESVGIVHRAKSEGDRRRSYVRLSEHSLGGLSPRFVEHAGRVVFVCSANSARSQLAAALWRMHSPIPALSGGTRPAGAIADGAVAAAERHAFTLPNVTPRHVSEVLTSDDFVVTVCDSAHEELAGRDRLHWSIPDPVPRETDAAFDGAVDELERRIVDLASRLTAS
ncbi:MAG: ArsR family transcriptional regulator [Microbacterium sp.]|uniref:Protein ArsC n=3 Tax=Microbacterium TaxID=33882 RepID=A0A0F0LY59_9MICO|nr:helix-turn-helix domain-containing protein [Microbacterium ginsengisoli]KJL37185.1 Protein ArsC [Microbacterium ginsengisoli]MAL07109.1 ArsR family transcriptional regulator [Microbacterium sp.]MBN9209677.1 helix-turn-helix domain-containing protein [Microbacterium ginsengisoli]